MQFEESELTSKERALFFYQFSSEHLDLHVRKYSSGDIITPRQMKHITDSLGVPGVETAKGDVANFYSSLYTETGYLRRNFILICVLLGRGEEAEKADLVFEAFDDDSSRKMELVEFDTMWECLVSNAIIHLPSLLTPPSSSTIEYLSRLKLSAPIAKAAIKYELMGEELSISMVIFRHLITLGRLKRILSPSGLRKLIYKYHLAQLPKNPIKLGKISDRRSRLRESKSMVVTREDSLRSR